MGIIFDKLNAYANSDYYGFHMPGHKRNKELLGIPLPYDLDITEIEGFDDLHHAEGLLMEAEQRLSDVYGAEESHYLINGSTSGILSAVLGCTQRGDTILMARNCHKSVYHAVLMNDLKPVYLYPSYDVKKELNGPISPEHVEKCLKENSEIRAVVIVSPTYDGVVSDIRKIAKIVHTYHIPLIVDEAHGAHFGFHPYFPENAIKQGADVIIHSLHKTLPSLTQTAVIHMNGGYENRTEIRMYLHMLQSSSPSYIFMAALDECVDMLRREKGLSELNQRDASLFEQYVRRLDETRSILQNELKHFQLVETEPFDKSKIVISVKGTGWSGNELQEILLKRYHLQMEMAAGSYVIAMTSIADTTEGFQRLVQALLELDRGFNQKTVKNAEIGQIKSFELLKLEQIYTPAEVRRRMKDKKLMQCFQLIPWEKSSGKVSAEFAYLYPPGIPLVVPGEKITEQMIKIMQAYQKMHFEIQGLNAEGFILVGEDSHFDKW